jgi:serine/threonine-protein kinase
LFGGGGGGNATVPDLTGKTAAEAQLALTSVGLVLGTETPTPDDKAMKGTIIGQDPIAGESLQKGQAVNVKVSNGRGATTIPDLVGLASTTDARTALEGAGLALGKITPQDSDKPEGSVLAQSPLAGNLVEAGTRVDITISSGKIAIPNVLGKDKTTAYSLLLAAGFNVQFIDEPRGDIGAGIVLAQSPLPGEVALKGATILLNVSVAPAPTPTPSPTATTP